MSDNTSNAGRKAGDVTRRDFVKTSAVVAAGTFAAAQLGVARSAHAAGSETIRIGLIGCGGRGSGAARDALAASERVQIVALADVFPDHLQDKRRLLAEHDDRAKVAEARCYVGFDAYKELLADGVDMVILATPPHFRPMHFAAAVDAGCHVFMEKPVAVDPTGIRQVLAAAEKADEKNLSVVAGTQRRHQTTYLEAMKRIHGGQIGRVVGAYCYWNQGGLWVKEKQPGWSDMEWQLRNWLYFTWASGDHIVEQHVHNLDVVNWAVGAHPVKAMGMGGREVRTEPKYGNIFDHHAIVYEYPGDVYMTSMCRQIDGCTNRVHEDILGSEGVAQLRGRPVIKGADTWRFTGQPNKPYVQEHADLIASIAGEGPHLNEGRRIAESTLTAIMGRMSTYSGKEITWDEALNFPLDLSPPVYEFGDLPMRPVAVPGQTAPV